jgi:flagellar hook protein FlgE
MTGVKNQQSALDVISNNIANVNTVGYKSSRMTFADAISDTISSARGTAGNFGGANPIQIGRGSVISSVDTNFRQGSVDATGIITDVAISGKGFFVVSDGTSNYFTRAGALQIMNDGHLLSQGGSHFIMGRLADASGKLSSTTAMNKIVLPFGRKEPARATENVHIYCNLDKNASRVEELLGQDQLLTKGKAATLKTDLALLDGNSIKLGDQIEINGTDKFGKKILDENNKVFTFTYGQDGTTIEDLLAKINLVFKSTNSVDGATATLDQAGKIRLEANAFGEGKFGLQLISKPDPNQAGTAENRAALIPMTAVLNNKVNQLNGGAAPSMNYQPGDTVDITYAVGSSTQTLTYTFATGNETLQDIVAFMNTNFTNARVVLQQGANANQVQIVDINQLPATITFSNNSSSAANGLTGTGQTFTLSHASEPATKSTDLRNLLNMSMKFGDTIDISGKNPDGSYVSGTFTYGSTADGTTIQDLLNTINRIFNGVTASLSPGGHITVTDNAVGESLSSIAMTTGTAVGFDIDFQTEIFTSSRMLEVGTLPATLTTNLNTLNSVSSTPYQVGDVIEIFAQDMNGPTRKVSFTFGPLIDGHDGVTIEDIINKVNNSNQFPGLTMSFQNGQFVFTDLSTNDLHDYTGIRIVNANTTIGRGLESAFATNAGTNNSVLNLPSFTSVQEGATGKHHSAITVYDSAGQKHRLEIFYTQDSVIGSNKWYWEILIDDGKLAPISGGSGTVNFNDNGSLRSFLYDNGTQLRFQPRGANEMKINLNAGLAGSFDGTTSMDSPSTNLLHEQDGYTLGVLNNINIDDHGIITGIYSNGVSKVLAQMAIATFTNEGGLQKEGNSLYAANGASGNPIIGWAGLNNSTQLKSGYLEASNVDLTEEFAKLIISQRALEANAKVVNTADMVLSTIIDRMKR